MIQYIAQQFTDTETQYIPIERKCLAIVRSLEEVQWVAIQSRFPIAVYTDFAALVSILKGNDSKGRIAAWQARLAEYDIDPRHVKVKHSLMIIADGLARMPFDSMNSAWLQGKEGEEVAQVELVEENKEGLDRIFKLDGYTTMVYNLTVGMRINKTGLLIRCDGFCRGDGPTDRQASVGIYFGIRHIWNRGERIPKS